MIFDTHTLLNSNDTQYTHPFAIPINPENSRALDILRDGMNGSSLHCSITPDSRPEVASGQRQNAFTKLCGFNSGN